MRVEAGSLRRLVMRVCVVCAVYTAGPSIDRGRRRVRESCSDFWSISAFEHVTGGVFGRDFARDWRGQRRVLCVLLMCRLGRRAVLYGPKEGYFRAE